MSIKPSMTSSFRLYRELHDDMLKKCPQVLPREQANQFEIEYIRCERQERLNKTLPGWTPFGITDTSGWLLTLERDVCLECEYCWNNGEDYWIYQPEKQPLAETRYITGEEE